MTKTMTQTRKVEMLPTESDPLPTFAENPCFALLKMPIDDAVKLVDQSREGLKGLEADISNSLKPAQAKSIILFLEALAVHHPMKEMSRAESDLWAKDWISDLAHVPADILESACAQWRRNPTPWMPKPGQLLELISPIVKYREALHRRCNLLLEQKK